MLRRVDALNLLRQSSVSKTDFFKAVSVIASSSLSRDESNLVIDSVRIQIERMTPTELVQLLKPVADLSRAEILPIAADVFTKLLDKSDSLSQNDIVKCVTICGRMGLFDSELFAQLDRRIHVNCVEDLKKIVSACNRLRYVFPNNLDSIVGPIARLVSCDTPLGPVVVPCMQYLASCARKDIQIPPEAVERCVSALEKSVSILRADEDLLKQRSFISSNDCLKFIVSYAKLAGGKPPTASLSEDLKFVLMKIVAYDVRSFSLEKSLKLFFSLDKLDVFEDFFIRRRLVPGIIQAYRDMNLKKSRDILLVLTVVSKLPFRNALVDEVVELISNDLETISPKDEFHDNITSLISQVRNS